MSWRRMIRGVAKSAESPSYLVIETTEGRIVAVYDMDLDPDDWPWPSYWTDRHYRMGLLLRDEPWPYFRHEVIDALHRRRLPIQDLVDRIDPIGVAEL